MTIRADHIGSLQRPRALLEEIHRTYETGHTALLADERAKDLTHLHALEDEAIRRVVARQGELGLDVVTDGEFRRLMYFNSFFDAVDGLAPSPPSGAGSPRSTARPPVRPPSCAD